MLQEKDILPKEQTGLGLKALEDALFPPLPSKWVSDIFLQNLDMFGCFALSQHETEILVFFFQHLRYSVFSKYRLCWWSIWTIHLFFDLHILFTWPDKLRFHHRRNWFIYLFFLMYCIWQDTVFCFAKKICLAKCIKSFKLVLLTLKFIMFLSVWISHSDHVRNLKKYAFLNLVQASGPNICVHLV